MLIRSSTIDEPGTYTFSCQYADGRSQPRVVLAIGANFTWEFLGIAARSSVTFAAGVVALFDSGLVATVIATIIVLTRRQSKRADVGG